MVIPWYSIAIIKQFIYSKGPFCPIFVHFCSLPFHKNLLWRNGVNPKKKYFSPTLKFSWPVLQFYFLNLSSNNSFCCWPSKIWLTCDTLTKGKIFLWYRSWQVRLHSNHRGYLWKDIDNVAHADNYFLL